ncbi:MAG: hypothetical protein J5927_00580 [Oscillospiraceae bacterium]|nr:hypothetical protein [Oscillospiraceae bacterium]
MKTLRRTLAFLFVLALMAGLTVTAFAAPGPEDMAALGVDQKIVMPEQSSYLSDYKTMYVNAAKELSIYCYSKPAEGMQLPRPVVFHGTRVLVLAEQDGYSCIRYRTADLLDTIAWIPSGFLSADYPGTTLEVGKSAGSITAAQGDVSWSWGRFPGTGGRYLYLAEPCKDCTGFTLDYQVIARGKAENKEIFGERTVYAYNGETWVKVGSFAYDALGPVHAVIGLDKPMDVLAIRTIADCKKPDAFVCREDVLDIRA